MDEQPHATAEQPPTIEEVFQPWELAGISRRDCASHRGRFLLWMGRISLLLGGLSLLCPPLGLPGLALGLLVRWTARRDLDAIFAGDMDHRGRQLTEKAWSDSWAAIFLNLLGSLLCGTIAGAVIWLLYSVPID